MYKDNPRLRAGDAGKPLQYDRVRWIAMVKHRSERGVDERVHILSEIADLGSLIEHGPHWDTILEIRINRVFPATHDLTIEAAERL